MSLAGILDPFFAEVRHAYRTGDWNNGQTGMWLAPYIDLLQFLLYFSIIYAYCSLAVYWHRYLLLGEKRIIHSPLRFDLPTLRYFRFFPVVLYYGSRPIAVAILIAFVLIYATTFSPAPRWFLSTLEQTVLIPLAYFMFRWGLALPAIAIGRTDFSFQHSWGLSKTVWRSILIQSLLTSLLATIFRNSYVLLHAAPILPLSNEAFDLILHLIGATAFTFLILLIVGQLSLAYEHLHQRESRGRQPSVSSSPIAQ